MPSAVSSLTDDLLKYYQQVTRAVLGDDPQLMKVRESMGTQSSLRIPWDPSRCLLPVLCRLTEEVGRSCSASTSPARLPRLGLLLR